VEDAEPPRTCTVTAFEQMCSCQKFWVSTRVVESGPVAHNHSPLFLTSRPFPPTARSPPVLALVMWFTTRRLLGWGLARFGGLCAAVDPHPRCNCGCEGDGEFQV
jgi:hypothetical protein